MTAAVGFHVFGLIATPSGAGPSAFTSLTLEGTSLRPGTPGVGNVFLYNKGTASTQVVEYSFDGTNVHGELDPTDGTRGVTLTGLREAAVYVRTKAGSTGPINVHAKYWVTRE